MRHKSEITLLPALLLLLALVPTTCVAQKPFRVPHLRLVNQLSGQFLPLRTHVYRAIGRLCHLCAGANCATR